MRYALMMTVVLLAACGPYDGEVAARRTAYTEAQRLEQVDPSAQYRNAYGTDFSNRGKGADLANMTDYYFDPATGYCFATLLNGSQTGIATVDCAKVKHMLLNPPPE